MIIFDRRSNRTRSLEKAFKETAKISVRIADDPKLQARLEEFRRHLGRAAATSVVRDLEKRAPLKRVPLVERVGEFPHLADAVASDGSGSVKSSLKRFTEVVRAMPSVVGGTVENAILYGLNELYRFMHENGGMRHQARSGPSRSLSSKAGVSSEISDGQKQDLIKAMQLLNRADDGAVHRDGVGFSAEHGRKKGVGINRQGETGVGPTLAKKQTLTQQEAEVARDLAVFYGRQLKEADPELFERAVAGREPGRVELKAEALEKRMGWASAIPGEASTKQTETAQRSVASVSDFSGPELSREKSKITKEQRVSGPVERELPPTLERQLMETLRKANGFDIPPEVTSIKEWGEFLATERLALQEGKFLEKRGMAPVPKEGYVVIDVPGAGKARVFHFRSENELVRAADETGVKWRSRNIHPTTAIGETLLQLPNRVRVGVYSSIKEAERATLKEGNEFSREEVLGRLGEIASAAEAPAERKKVKKEYAGVRAQEKSGVAEKTGRRQSSGVGI